MGVAEAGVVKGDKPLAHADKSPAVGSAKAFNDALGRTAGPASSSQTAGETPTIVRVDATHRHVESARAEAWTKELAPRDPFEGAEWKGDPAAVTEQWDTFAFDPYDKALTHEASGPRLGEVAPMAQNAIFQGFDLQGLGLQGFGSQELGLQGLGLPAAVGRGGALLAAGGEALSLPTLLEGSTAVSSGTLLGQFAKFGMGESLGANLNLTGEELRLSTGEHVTGGFPDVFEGAINIMGVRGFAKAPGAGDGPVPRRTSADPVNGAATSIPKRLSSGSRGVDDVAGTAEKGKASVGGDAADTVRMRKLGTGESSKPSAITNFSRGETGETARHLPGASGDNVRPKKVGTLDVSKMEAGATGIEARAAVPTRSVDQIVDAYTRGRSPAEIRNGVSESDIARLKELYKAELRKNGQAPEIADSISNDQYRRMAMAEDVYRHYNRPVAGKPEPTISEAELNARLKKYDGPTESPDGWHVRMNKTAPGAEADHSWVNADQAHPVDRFYVNVKADHAPEFADHVSDELNKKGIKFQLKVASEIDGYARADSGLVYTQGKDFDAVSDVISQYRALHPEAIAEGSPAFTKPLGKGVSVAEEPIQEGLPVVWHGVHSFGTAQANVIAEAISKAPAAASVEQIRVLARARLQSAGFDPDHPWLAQGSRVDRFRDINVARANASNAGAAFDDTMPLPAAEEGPPSLPRRQGDPRGDQGASSAEIANQVAARQHAEQLRSLRGPNLRTGPNRGGSVGIESLLDDMQRGNLKVVDNAFNGRFHDQVWQNLTGREGQAPAAYTIGDQARVDLNRLTPEQLERYRAYVQKQDAANRPY